ncbi:hypothetical protein ACJX0J_013761, partial [Zea mays]
HFACELGLQTLFFTLMQLSPSCEQHMQYGFASTDLPLQGCHKLSKGQHYAQLKHGINRIQYGNIADPLCTISSFQPHLPCADILLSE